MARHHELILSMRTPPPRGCSAPPRQGRVHFSRSILALIGAPCSSSGIPAVGCSIPAVFVADRIAGSVVSKGRLVPEVGASSTVERVADDVIRATARMLQIRSRLENDDVGALVAEAESGVGTLLSSTSILVKGRESFQTIGRHFSSRRDVSMPQFAAQSIRSFVRCELSLACSGETTTTIGSGWPSHSRKTVNRSLRHRMRWPSWSFGSMTRSGD